MTDSAIPYEVVGNALRTALRLLEALRANTIPTLTHSDAPSDANQDADERFRTAVAARIESVKPTVNRFLDASDMAEPYISDDASELLDEIKKLQKSIIWAQVTYIEAPPGRVLASAHIDGFGAAPQKEIDRLRVEARRLLRPRPEFNQPPLQADAQTQLTTKRSHDEPLDVFLSHNSRDKPAVRQLKANLVENNVSVWFDEEQLQPGIPWQPLLEYGIKSSRSVAVLVGNDGIGPWENEEMRAALQLAVRDKRPVIPVLLPGSPAKPELPLFLANRTWVDLRDGMTDDGVAMLIWGITGKKPRLAHVPESPAPASLEPTRHAAKNPTPVQPQALSSSFTPMLKSPTTTNTILFMAANPAGTDERTLGEQARAIQGELERSGYRDRFAFETRWAAQPLDLLRDMVKRKPTVVHVCGGRLKEGSGEPTAGVYVQGTDGSAQLVPREALADAFESVGSVKLVILDACYSEHYADAIAAHIDCVIGMTGGTVDQAATSFSIGLYGGIGEGESVAAAFKQGRAAIGMTRAGDSHQPQLRVRPGVDASQIILANPR